MGFWDRDVCNGFNAMFDLNRDGYLEPFEQAMQFQFIEEGIRRDSGEREEDELFGTDLG